MNWAEYISSTGYMYNSELSTHSLKSICIQKARYSAVSPIKTNSIKWYLQVHVSAFKTNNQVMSNLGRFMDPAQTKKTPASPLSLFAHTVLTSRKQSAHLSCFFPSLYFLIYSHKLFTKKK